MADRKNGNHSLLQVMPCSQPSVDIRTFDWSLLEKHKVCVSMEISSMKKTGPSSFRLYRSHKKGVKEVDVYLTTDQWNAVDSLREMRNIHIGHASSTALSDDDLKGMFARVKEAYQTLGISPAIVEELEEIEKGMN